MKKHPYKVTVVEMNGRVTQEIIWAVSNNEAKERVQVELPETLEVYKIGVEYPTKKEMQTL